MIYNIEIAQAFCSEKEVNQDAFYKSMLKSFEEALMHVNANSQSNQFASRLQKIVTTAFELNWINRHAFDEVLSTR